MSCFLWHLPAKLETKYVVHVVFLTSRTVSSTPPGTAVNVVKRVIMETQPNGPATPVRAPPRGTSQLLFVTQLNRSRLIFALHKYEDLIPSLCSFALACLDVGSGEVECLCKRGYSGAKCERWVCCSRCDTIIKHKYGLHFKTFIGAPNHCILIPTVQC